MAPGALLHKELTQEIIGCFYTVHNILGFGFLENVYAAALTHELRSAGIKVIREYLIPVRYKGALIARYRADMVIEGKLIVEIKSSRFLHPDAQRQVYNYLRATDLELGLLLHFGPSAKFNRIYLTNDRKSVPLPSNP
jgi:GxxExxY protein